MKTPSIFRVRKTFSLVIALGGILAAGTVRGEVSVDDKPLQVFHLEPHDQSEKPPVITAVALSRDGRLLAAGGDDHLVRIWSILDGRVVHEMRGHTDWVRCVLFSPDGKTLVTGGDDRRVRQWDVATGRELKTLKHDEAVYALAYTFDGATLAAAGFESKLRTYDGKTGAVLRVYDCPCRDIRCVAFSANARSLAAAGRDGQIRTWNTADGTVANEWPAHPKRIRALAFSFDELLLASAAEDRQLRVWDAHHGTEMYSLAGSPSKLMSLVFCGTDKLATGGSDNIVHLWDMTTRQEIRQYVGHLGSITTLACDCENGLIVSGSFDTTIRVWQMNRVLDKNSTTLRIDGTSPR